MGEDDFRNWNVELEVSLFHAMRRHKPVGEYHANYVKVSKTNGMLYDSSFMLIENYHPVCGGRSPSPLFKLTNISQTIECRNA